MKENVTRTIFRRNLTRGEVNRDYSSRGDKNRANRSFSIYSFFLSSFLSFFSSFLFLFSPRSSRKRDSLCIRERRRMKSFQVDNVDAIPYRLAGWSTREILNGRKRPTRRKVLHRRILLALKLALPAVSVTRFRFIRSNKTLEKRIARFVRFLRAARSSLHFVRRSGSDVEIVGHDLEGINSL